MDTLLTELPALASTFALAFFSFWSAIPLGLALGLSPLAVIVTTTLSYASGAALVAFVGGRFRDWAARRLGQRGIANPEGRMMRVWQRWGIWGLGLAAPMTLGAQLGAALGLALNAPPRRLFAALALGALVWSAILTVLFSLGLLGAQAVVAP